MHIEKASGGVVGIGHNSMQWDRQRNEIVIAVYGPDTVVEQKVGVQAYVVFDEETLAYSDPAIGILNMFDQRVDQILAAVEAESNRIGLIT